MAMKPAQMQVQQAVETDEEILPISFVKGRLISVAPLQTVDLQGLRNGSSLEIERLHSAAQYPGFCYLQLGTTVSATRSSLLVDFEEAARTAAQVLMPYSDQSRYQSRPVSALTAQHGNFEEAYLTLMLFSDSVPQYTFEIRMAETGLEDGREWAHVVPKPGCALLAVKGTQRRISNVLDLRDDRTWIECKVH